MENKGTNLTPEQALDRLEERYEQSVNALREAIADYIDSGTLPNPMQDLTDYLFILLYL